MLKRRGYLFCKTILHFKGIAGRFFWALSSPGHLSIVLHSSDFLTKLRGSWWGRKTRDAEELLLGEAGAGVSITGPPGESVSGAGMSPTGSVRQLPGAPPWQQVPVGRHSL